MGTFLSISDMCRIRWWQRVLNREHPPKRVDHIDPADIRKGLRSQLMLTAEAADKTLKKRKQRKGSSHTQSMTTEEFRNRMGWQ